MTGPRPRWTFHGLHLLRPSCRRGGGAPALDAIADEARSARAGTRARPRAGGAFAEREPGVVDIRKSASRGGRARTDPGKPGARALKVSTRHGRGHALSLHGDTIAMRRLHLDRARDQAMMRSCGRDPGGALARGGARSRGFPRLTVPAWCRSFHPPRHHRPDVLDLLGGHLQVIRGRAPAGPRIAGLDRAQIASWETKCALLRVSR